MSRVTSVFAPSGRSSTPAHRSPSSPSRARQVLLFVVLIIVGIIVLARWVASPIATHLVNRKLNSLPDYRGEVGAVKIALWRAGAEIDDVVLYQKDGDKELPLVKMRKAGFRIAWSALVRGNLGGELKVENPEVTVVKVDPTPKDDGKDAKEKVKEVADKIEPWRDAVQKAFPMELTRLEVSEAKFRFVDRTHQPNPDLVLEHVHLLATGLRNRTEGEALPAKLELRGTTTGNGRLAINVQADPLAKTPRFHVTMELSDVSLPAANAFLAAYANADVSRGSFDFYLEANAEGGRYEGYVKPFLKDVDFKTASDKNKNVAQRLAKAATNAVVNVLKNDEEQKVATKAPFSGTFDENKLDVWGTIQNLLRNAFVQALREGFDHRPGRATG